MTLDTIEGLAEEAKKVPIPSFLEGIEHGEEPYYRFLWLLAGQKIGGGSIVELGTWRGVSAMCLAEGAPDTKVHTLDIGPQVTESTRRPNISYAVQDSRQVIAEAAPVVILFIDTLHTADVVEAEFKAWLPFLSKDAVVLFDDVELNESMSSFWKDFNPEGFKKSTLDLHGGFGVLLKEA